MATLTELQEKWSTRLAEWRALGVHVAGERLAAEVLNDLRALVTEDVVTLQEASLIGGYSVDHLQRLVAGGTIGNVGRKGAPRVRRADVPIKPGHGSASLPTASPPDSFSARRRIVADAQTQRGA